MKFVAETHPSVQNQPTWGRNYDQKEKEEEVDDVRLGCSEANQHQPTSMVTSHKKPCVELQGGGGGAK